MLGSKGSGIGRPHSNWGICELKLWLRLFHEEFKMQGCQLILGMHNQSQVNHSGGWREKQASQPNFRQRSRGRELISSKKKRIGENIRPFNERKNRYRNS